MISMAGVAGCERTLERNGGGKRCSGNGGVNPLVTGQCNELANAPHCGLRSGMDDYGRDFEIGMPLGPVH